MLLILFGVVRCCSKTVEAERREEEEGWGVVMMVENRRERLMCCDAYRYYQEHVSKSMNNKFQTLKHKHDALEREKEEMIMQLNDQLAGMLSICISHHKADTI